MDYLFFKLWPFLALAFVMGLIWGYFTCPGSRPRKDR